ncbi:MAG TPA: DUF5996 family protein [Usitatibacter sp.]|nr:DUF5996 family protein [Usitatibacter sp.]
MNAGTGWPALPLGEWGDTYHTLHMWMQVVGKLVLATTPLTNHHWNVAFHYAARGLATQPMHVGAGRTLTATFDFVEHRLLLQASDGAIECIALAPRTVADFHAAVMDALERLGAGIRIRTMPVEVPDAIAFERDTIHRSYDASWANAFWRALVCMRPVFEEFRGGFVGKCSPLHFFWGSFDLALTRFSGRRAKLPPNADPITREAYSHEVISHGWWPGGGDVEEAVFYAYARPEPEGFPKSSIEPAAARYEDALAEFILPYEAVRTAASPERDLLAFLESTYEAAATLGKWDRAALERTD